MTDTQEKSSGQGKEATRMRIRYDKMEVEFGSQFLVNASGDELILNISPGFITDPQTNERMMPIQTRIAMTPAGAARLVNILSAALKNQQKAAASGADAPQEASTELQ